MATTELAGWGVAGDSAGGRAGPQARVPAGTRLGYVAGNSAFAAGYLIVLLLSPLLGCALGAWGARSWPESIGAPTATARPRMKRSPTSDKHAAADP